MRLPHAMKGGVWKNTEDEILKAAVMKYGKNQWARISSLLVRKSAKQCKTRWYEWLDPSIKKTEWSREEEEKLLHLAKLMPTQWRTIAPIVGRTAAQCLEHYEKLLDAAQGKDEGYDARDDPRRLRPGEIDPNPEAKPARPDPVDMDEDEKEMLQEARARLANTRGKKAKRKAREKQLEEARRLAALQKRRELRAAGIDIRNRRKKGRGIDYRTEIPFQKNAPAGLFPTGPEEEELPPQPFRRQNLERLKEKRRDVEEEKLRQKDREKQRRRREVDMPGMIMQVNKMNDPDAVRKFMKMTLPTPQMSDQELEEIAKINSTAVAMDDGEGAAATRALMPAYGATPRAASTARTPVARTPAREDRVRMEAENLLALTHAQTPLKGGENITLHPSDFSGATPRKQDTRTPNVLATPGPHAGAMTPAKAAPTPARTPLRDNMRINEDGAFMDEDESDAMDVETRLSKLGKQLSSKLSTLPAPQHQYSLALPPDAKQQLENELAAASGSGMAVEDAADVEARQRRDAEREEQARLARRSTVLQRGLPRPIAVNGNAPRVCVNRRNNDLERVEDMIQAEAQSMLAYDSVVYPVPNAKQKMSDAAANDFVEMGESDLAAAKALIQEEMAQSEATRKLFTDPEKVAQYSQSSLVFCPSQRAYIDASKADPALLLDALQFQFESIRTKIGQYTTRGMKLEKKVDVYTKGLVGRSNKIFEEIVRYHRQLEEARVEHSCFQKLNEFETFAIPQRISELQAEVDELQAREDRLQLYYEALTLQLDTTQ